MNEQRTRTRRRPSTNASSVEARTGGTPISEQQTTEHKPSRQTRLAQVNNQLVAYVQIKDGVTLNMLDFNSFRRDVSVELPVPVGPIETIDDLVDADGNLMPDVEDTLDRVYGAMDRWVGRKHETTVQDATEFFEG